MAPPFPVPPGALVIKVEDERESDVSGQVNTDQELRDMFTKDVKRQLELIRRRKGLQPGFAQPQHPPVPSVQQAPLPPPPPPPPPAQHPCTKRLAMGPPPGFEGARTPPLKQYNRRPPGPPKPPAQPQQQPAPPPPHAHRAPAAAPPPALHAQRAGHAPHQPAPPGAHGHGATATAPAPIAVVVPALPRRAAAPGKPKAAHPAAKKKPTVPCTFCGVLCMTAWHLKQHEQGRKHRNRVAYLAGEMNVQCSVCNVHLSSGLNVQQHYAGKQHLLRVNKGGA